MVEANAPTKKQSKNNSAVYTFTFSGMYYPKSTGSGGSLTEKEYTITLKMSHAHVNTHGAKSTFKRVLAPKYMPKKYPDFDSLATFHIVSSSCDNPALLAANVNALSRDGMLTLIADNDMDINTALYADDDDELRTAITMYQEDPEAYERYEKMVTAKKGAHATAAHEALQLNKELDDLNSRSDWGDDEDAEIVDDPKPKSKSKDKDKDKDEKSSVTDKL